MILKSRDKSNPNYFILYEDYGIMDKENLEGQEYHLEPLFTDYFHHCIKVLSVGLDQDEIGSILLVTFNMAFTLILTDILSSTGTLVLLDLPPSV